MNHMLHGAVARIGGAIKRIEGADGAKYSASIVSFTAYYFGDWETIITAKAIPDVIRGIIIGIIFLIYASISRDMISDAYFYSSYFEGNLYGNIKYSDLAAITGEKI